MKACFAYILFLAFALRPAYNLGYVAYFELNIDYIIETYCVNKEEPKLQCNGKCHLAKQLKSTPNNSTEETSPYLTSFFEAFFPVYFQEYAYNFKLKENGVLKRHNWNYNTQLISLFKENLDRPPQV